MLFDLLFNNEKMTFDTVISGIIASLIVIFVTLPFHEFAHAFVASKLGDKTARYRGRLTLNPLVHIDYMGALFILLFGFGWANPVPVNANNFKNPKAGMALTALAGPLMNILLAFVGCIAGYGFAELYFSNGTEVFKYLAIIFLYFRSLNIGLAVFNLLPIPPLDGWKVLGVLLPSKYYWMIMSYERYISFGLMLLIFSGSLDVPIYWLSDRILYLVEYIPALIFGYI